MKGGPALLRIAWREAWRPRRRSALVIALVAVAVAAGGVNAGRVGSELPVVVPWAWILAAVGGVVLTLTAAGWLTAGGRALRSVEADSVIRL